MVSNILSLQNAKAYCYCNLWKCILPSSIGQFPFLSSSGGLGGVGFCNSTWLVLYPLKEIRPFVERGPLSSALVLRHVGVGRSAGRKEEGKDGWWEGVRVFMARAQNRPFTLMGGQSVHARLCLGRECLGLLLTLLPSNNHAVSPQRQGWWCQDRSERTHLLNITHIQ